MLDDRSSVREDTELKIAVLVAGLLTFVENLVWDYRHTCLNQAFMVRVCFGCGSLVRGLQSLIHPPDVT